MDVCKKEGEIFQVNIDYYWYEKDVEPSDGVLVFKTKRANTFQYCICLEENLHTNAELDSPGNGPYWDAVEDKNGQMIRRFKCIKRKNTPKEVTLPYCKHKQICKTQYFENAGTEKPGIIIEVNNSTESCICRAPGTCQVTDRSSPYTVVSQCIVDKNKTPHLRRCIPGQVYMEEIHHNISTGNGEFRVFKNHTIIKCICEQTMYNTELIGNMTISNHSTDAQKWIHSYSCPRHVSAVEEVESCLDYAVCRIDIFTHYGEDFGLDAKYLKNRLHFCECDRDRICNITEKDFPKGASTTNDTYRCLEKNKGQTLSPCTENSEFLVEISRVSSNKSTEVKLNTFLKCVCEHDGISYESFQNRSIIDPSVPDQLLRTYKCALRLIRPDENRYCTYNTSEDCLKVRHDHYGRERTGEFSFHSRKLCTCISPEVCIPYRTDDLITFHRCEPKKCRADEVCRILEYSEYTTNRVLERNETLCHCNGQCNYRPVASIVISHAFENATVYHTCKIPEI